MTGNHKAGRLSPRSVVTLLVALVLSIGLGYVGYQRVSAMGPKPVSYQTVPVSRANIASTVSATGNVIAQHQAKVTFTNSGAGSVGTIKEVDVALGDTVKAGQVLAKQDTTALENKLKQTESSLHTAQINLDKLRSGATPAETAAAQAALNSAEAAYDKLIAPPQDADVKADQNAVDSAQAALTKAQGALTTLQQGPSQNDIAIAKADMDTKKAAVVQAQAAYDKVSWRGDISALPQASALQAATDAYITSQANYNKVIAPPNPQDVASDQAAVASAQTALASAKAKLAQLMAGPSTSDVAAAKASIANAKAQLALKVTPSTADDIAAGQESVNQAQLNVNSATIDLQDATLVAPFNGKVAAIAMNPGEQSGSSYITIVDTSAVRVDMAVAEADLSKVTVGKPTHVTLDALPGETFQGKVTAISPNSTVTQGVVTYMVSVQLDTNGVYLPEGLTANVDVIVDQRNNVLAVPNRAVTTQGRNHVVNVLVDGKPEARQVTVGLSNDTLTEITQGLQVGDQAVIPTTTTTGTSGGGGVPRFGGGGIRVGGPGF